MSRTHRPDQSPAANTSGCAPAEFFAFRTPLLPFDTLLTWGEGLSAPAVHNNPAALEQALADDRARLRAYLRDQIARPEVHDALFVASPDLDASIEHWLHDPESERGQKVERALVRYVVRMAGRATPFGLFSGCSVGATGETTRLALCEHTDYQRHTRLDMDYLFALAEALGHAPTVRQALRYRPNSSLYHAAGRVRYAEARLNGKIRSYHLVAVESTSYLESTLERASCGASPADLAAALVAGDPDVSLAEAAEYVNELIESQLLVSDLAPAVTGAEPIHGLIEQLGLHATTTPIAGRLGQVREALAMIDRSGPGAPPEAYRAVAALLDGLPAEVTLNRLFQVDMVKPAPEATLGRAVIDEIARGVDLLWRLSSVRQDNLARFREAFVARYEGREAPLVEVLDEDAGIGFAAANGVGAATSPLLDGLAFPNDSAEQNVPWGMRQALLLRKIEAALQNGARAIDLSADDLTPFQSAPRLPLADSFAVMATVAANSQQALNQGDFQVLIEGSSGPSGACLLGRFCHADPALQQHVQHYLRQEEALRPDAIFAEIVHLPEGRVGNILCRPVLRDHEIIFLGQSGADPDKRIPITDLLISVDGDRIVLRSARLGREVIPRLTSAHNYAWRSLSVYRFLCALQHQGIAAGVGWDWGPLESAAFLPRVTSGRLVLARARWHIDRDELQSLGAARGAARFHAVQNWRTRLQLPRFVVLADGDNELPVDLDNALSVESFVDLVKGRGQATLFEMFPAPHQLCANGPEGRFVHELVVPFVRTVGAPAPQPPLITRAPANHHARNFPPGSEWLYARLYTGAAIADQVLCSVVEPVVTAAIESGAADSWFFIRYSDPDWHLRLRLHGHPELLCAKVLPALAATAAPLQNDGQLWRMQFDTYEREVERYGGPIGIELAERLFHADSAAALAITTLLDGDAGADARWRLALRGIDMLLDDLGFDFTVKRALVRRVRDAYLREFRADGTLTRQLGQKYRHMRATLDALFDPAQDADSPLAPGFAILRQRSAQTLPIAAELRAAERAGKLTMTLEELAPSYIHMHVNRMLRAAQRAQELVLYELLDRIYESRSARTRQQVKQ